MHDTRINIDEVDRKELVELLNDRLADTLDLYTQTKQAHWNVKGTDFFQLHELFDDLAGRLVDFVDMLAERATTLGGTALGTARMAAAGSSLPEYPAEATTGVEHLTALADRYGRFGALLRAAIEQAEAHNDADSADLFTEVSRAVDKDLWFLEAHLQG